MKLPRATPRLYPARDDLGILRTKIEDENFGRGGGRDSLHGLGMLRVRFEAWIIGIIGWAKSPVPGDATLKFLARLLHDRFFQRVGATGGQDRVRDANGGEKGFQALRIMGAAAQCKGFENDENEENDEL